MNCRGMGANVFACAIVAAMTPLGCGGVQEEPLYVRQESAPRSMTEPDLSVEAPAATVRAMKACVEAMSHQSSEPSHAFQYNLTASQRGDVLDVSLRDSTVQDAPLEACFERALSAMQVPKDALRLRSSKPVSGGESMSSSRADIGIVQAAAAPIALAPIVIPALGFTIIVAISFDIIRKATSDDAERDRCREVNEVCQQKCLPKLQHFDFGNLFHRCMRQCREAAGCW